ncbi:MAG TPA: RAMP superfamily CRISPR-associated protein [Actinomycetaceae bacterium]|nr:RAMP superfamily CRISPR-associated protein [Actinomycetaceae bacterium]
MTATYALERRFIIRGKLRAETPIHPGSGEPGMVSDLTIERDGRNRPVVRGTQLAGVLTDALRRECMGSAWEPALKKAWGTQDSASRVIVDDAPLLVDASIGSVHPERLDGIAMDRRQGTVAPGALYSREVLPEGSEFDFSLEVEDDGVAPPGVDWAARGWTESEPESWGHALIGELYRLLARGIRVGAATNRGLGQLKLTESSTVTVLDYTDQAAVLESLRTRDEDARKALVPEIGSGVPGGTIRFTVHWRPLGTILSGIETDGAVSLMPRTATSRRRRDGLPDLTEVRLQIPGSGIKGALRSRGEYIVRTVLDAESRGSPLEDCADDRLHEVAALFGSPGREVRGERGGDGKRVSTQTGRRGAVSFSDARSALAIPSAQWNPVLTALTALTDAPEPAREREKPEEKAARRKRNQKRNFRRAVEELNTAAGALGFEVVDRVAIDRWTGGAAESRLYAALEPTVSVWEPLIFDLDSHQLPEEGREDAVAVFMLVLRDLAEGWIPLGRGTRRGWGTIEVTAVEVENNSGFLGDALPGGNLLAPKLDQQEALDELIGEWFARRATVGAEGES